jgi:catechol-2,3-dioxygenase
VKCTSRAADPTLKLRYLSRGTLESKNSERAKQFYTEFAGLEVFRTSPVSIVIRLSGNNTIAVVEQKRSSAVMSLFNRGEQQG